MEGNNNNNNNSGTACTVDDVQANGTGNGASSAISPNTVAAAAPRTQEVCPIVCGCLGSTDCTVERHYLLHRLLRFFLSLLWEVFTTVLILHDLHNSLMHLCACLHLPGQSLIFVCMYMSKYNVQRILTCVPLSSFSSALSLYIVYSYAGYSFYATYL